MEEILKLITTYGLTTVLFIFLFFYNIKDSKEREAKYQEIITSLTEKFGVIEEVKKDVEEIKNKLF
jgi:hypothetical protein